MFLETECILSSHVITFLGIRTIERACNKFKVFLQTDGNGLFTVAGAWRDLDGFFRQISKITTDEKSTRGYSLTFAPNTAADSVPVSALLKAAQQERLGSTSSYHYPLTAEAGLHHDQAVAEARFPPVSHQSRQSATRPDATDQF